MADHKVEPMKSLFKRKIKSTLASSLADLPAFTESRQQFVELRQQFVEFRQQFGDLQLQLVHLQEGLLANQFDHSSRRRILNETAAISQSVQLLLRQKYRDLLDNHLALPELTDTEFRCFSQNGEDGILLYIFSILGTTNKRVVEIGAGDGIECNSANLIINHGWQGLLFDCDEQNISRGKEFYAKCQDTFADPPTQVVSWITAEKLVSLVVVEIRFFGIRAWNFSFTIAL